MAKKKKSIKKYGQTPPLSKEDKKIVFVIFFGMLALFFILALAGIFFPRLIGWASEDVVASQGGNASFFVILTSLLCLSVSLLFGKLLGARPLFGNPKVNYDDPKWNVTYPIFDKRYHAKKKDIFVMLLVFLLLLIALVCVFFSLFHITDRQVIKENGDITVYNGFREETYFAEDISEMELYTDYVRSNGRRSFRRSHWRFEFSLTMKSGKIFYFNADCFAFINEALLYTQMLKDIVGRENITIEDKNRLDRIIEDNNYSDKQAELLYELFE